MRSRLGRQEQTSAGRRASACDNGKACEDLQSVLFVFLKLRLPLLQTSLIPAPTFWKRCGDPWTRCLEKRYHDRLCTLGPTVRMIVVCTHLPVDSWKGQRDWVLRSVCTVAENIHAGSAQAQLTVQIRPVRFRGLFWIRL